MWAIDIQLGNLPIAMSCYANGTISFERLGNFKPIVEYSGDGLQICLSNDDVIIGTTTYEDGEMINYKIEPELLAWLQAQDLQVPNFI